MPSAMPRPELVIRPKQCNTLSPKPAPLEDQANKSQAQHQTSHATSKAPHSPVQRTHSPNHSRTSPPASRRTNLPGLHTAPHQHSHEYAPYKPPRRHQEAKPTVAVINSSGRQAASFIRVASAVGYHVRAQLRNLEGIVANEVSALPHVQTFVGELYTDVESGAPNLELIDELFQGAQVAFINTTFWGDEVAIGKACADAAKRHHVKHYIYSSMPDHAHENPAWPSVPLWSAKNKVENYVRQIGLPATFLYTGIYNNNFTSLPYPLFQMELQKDGSFVWQAPFHPHVPLPWLDADHDVGTAVLQLIKDGTDTWLNQRIMLAFEMLSPVEACRAFAKGVGRPVRYIHGPIGIQVHIPTGYREQLEAVETMYELGKEDPKLQPPYFGSNYLELSCPGEALALWEGYRGLEEYAREDFIIEEWNNGLRWMEADGIEGTLVRGDEAVEEDADDDADSDVLTMGKRREEQWLA